MGNSTVETLPLESPTSLPPNATVSSIIGIHKIGTNIDVYFANEVGIKAIDAARLMRDKRINCVLVCRNGNLSDLVGIITDKDLVFRGLAQHKSPQDVTLDKIMTPNPISVTTDTKIEDALKNIVEGGFRHLPVVCSTLHDSSTTAGVHDSRGPHQVAGILDITKLLFSLVTRLERQCSSSYQLREALEDVSRAFEDSINDSRHLLVRQYAETLYRAVQTPTLSDIMSPKGSIMGTDLTAEESLTRPVNGVKSPPLCVSINADVLSAVQKMKELNESAILVFDLPISISQVCLPYSALVGIVTTKDVVLRVLAEGRDPSKTTVSKIMTPFPDVCLSDTRVVDAYGKMQAGRYLHLPVVSQNIVDTGASASLSSDSLVHSLLDVTDDSDKCVVGQTDILRLSRVMVLLLEETKASKTLPSSTPSSSSVDGSSWHSLLHPSDEEGVSPQSGSLHGPRMSKSRYHQTRSRANSAPAGSSHATESRENRNTFAVVAVERQLSDATLKKALEENEEIQTLLSPSPESRSSSTSGESKQQSFKLRVGSLTFRFKSLISMNVLTNLVRIKLLSVGYTNFIRELRLAYVDDVGDVCVLADDSDLIYACDLMQAIGKSYLSLRLIRYVTSAEPTSRFEKWKLAVERVVGDQTLKELCSVIAFLGVVVGVLGREVLRK